MPASALVRLVGSDTGEQFHPTHLISPAGQHIMKVNEKWTMEELPLWRFDVVSIPEVPKTSIRPDLVLRCYDLARAQIRAALKDRAEVLHECGPGEVVLVLFSPVKIKPQDHKGNFDGLFGWHVSMGCAMLLQPFSNNAGLHTSFSLKPPALKIEAPSRKWHSKDQEAEDQINASLAFPVAKRAPGSSEAIPE